MLNLKALNKYRKYTKSSAEMAKIGLNLPYFLKKFPGAPPPSPRQGLHWGFRPDPRAPEPSEISFRLDEKNTL